MLKLNQIIIRMFIVLINDIKYHIHVNTTPLLIKPPLLQNLIKIQISRHFFAQKSTFWGFFEQKFNKFPSHFNKPPPKNPKYFIGRRRGIDADTVIIFEGI